MARFRGFSANLNPGVRYCFVMDLAAKLQLKPNQSLKTVSAPHSVAPMLLELEHVGDGSQEAALLVFVTNRSVLDGHVEEIAEAASKDHLTWVAYPKAGHLGTDLNRDSLAALLVENGVQPVRQIAIDDVWSALRFRPGKRRTGVVDNGNNRRP
jgi:hypothetical protein